MPALDGFGDIEKFLQGLGHEVTDFGCYSAEPVDFPDIALLVAEAVRKKEFDRGVLVDGFNGAMPLAANKVRGIRAAVCSEPYSARLTRQHNNANIIAFGARVVGADLANNAVATVYSRGRNGAAAPASTDEQANGNADRLFVSHTPTPAGANDFDDLVTWISPNILYNRLIAAGRLP